MTLTTRSSRSLAVLAALVVLSAVESVRAAEEAEPIGSVLERTIFAPVDAKLTGGNPKLKELLADLARLRKAVAAGEDPTERANQGIAATQAVGGEALTRGRAAYLRAQFRAVLADHTRARRPETAAHVKALVGDLDAALASVPELRVEILAERGRARAALVRLDRGAAAPSVPALKAALADLDEAVRADPEWPRVLVERGRVQLLFGAIVAELEGDELAGAELSRPHLERALADFEAALRREPALTDALSGAGNALGQLGRWPEAAARLEAASERADATPELRRDLTRAREKVANGPAEIAAARAKAANALDAGDYAGAAALCTEALRLDGGDAQALLLRGQALLYAGQLARADDDLTRAVALRPNDALAHALRGQVRAETKQLPAAVADLQRALELDPKLLDAVFGLALAYLRMGDLERSIEVGEKGVARGPEWFSGWYNLAAAYSRRSAVPGRAPAARRSDRDRAFAALEAYASGAPKAQGTWESVSRDPDLAALRTDPRYNAVLKRLGPGRPKRTVEDWAEDTTR